MPVTTRSRLTVATGQIPPNPDWAGSHLAAITSNFKLPEYPRQSDISLPFRPPGYGHLCPPSKHDVSHNNNNKKLFNF